VRWAPAGGENIGPDEFIPVAEETGLILPIGEWVLGEACKAAAQWPTDATVAVNLSPVQFRAADLIEKVTAVLDDAGLAPERLEIEITESLLLDDTVQTLDTLHRLRALGVRLSMDDFGTGYSSLSYFRSFPFDKIKIDRSFIAELGERDDNLAIITAVIGLSRRLGMSTTAEGVETEEQMNLLREEGCEEAQGYLFSPPLPAGAVGLLLGADARAAGNAPRRTAAQSGIA
jgi:EAL domain-containing protein (putative c-di-GMP-specific phosphodiesterase class I)